MNKFWARVARFSLKRATPDSGLVSYALKELGHDDEDTLAVVRAFAMAGHSGSSADATSWVLGRLLRFQPLSHLNGTADEWVEVGSLPANDCTIFQNRRRSTVFKEVNPFGKTMKTYDIDGKVFVYPDGTYTTRGGDHTPITFPYWPPADPEEVRVNEDGTPYVSLEDAVGQHGTDAIEGMLQRGAQAKLQSQEVVA